MEHVPVAALMWERGSAETFTGTVWASSMSRRPGRSAAALGVLFEPGARTFWHSHPDGQLLYVASGAGRVGAADGAVLEITMGDTVYASPGERHWHGANPDTYMMHLSITTGGATEWEPTPVTDTEYNGNS